MRYSGRSVYGVVAALAGTLAIPWSAQGQTPAGPTNNSSYDASAGIQRFYVSSPQDDIPTLSPDSLTVSHLFEGGNQRIYRHPELVKVAIAHDSAIAAFCNSAEYGARAKAVINGAILYAGIPRAGANGFNDFNTQRPGVGARAALVNQFQVQRAGKAPSPATTTPLSPEARNLPVLGNIQPQELTGGQTGETAGGLTLQQRVARARESFPKDFSTVVGLSPDGRQAVLYVFGELPAVANTEAPINFTVIAKQYGPEASDGSEWAEHASSVTLLDKQTLAPSADRQPRYFCFQYPIPASARNGQTDMLVSYWISPSLAYTHGIAVARSASGSWIAIPMSRLERFQRDFRYQVVQNTEPGSEIQPANYIAGRVAERRRRKLAP